MQMRLRDRMALMSVLIFFVAAIYMGAQKYVQDNQLFSDLNLLLPGEDQIPFFPLAIILYFSEYFLPVWLFVTFRHKLRVMKIFVAFMITICIHGVFYFMMPVPYTLRPALTFDTYPYIFINLLYQLDAPINTFPSMHVSFAFLTYFVVRHFRPRYKTAFLIIALLISASTILVKQHYILDAVSGAFLAWLVYYLWISKDYDSFDSYFSH